jgi:GT2 family glycosyltransferase
LSNDTKVAVLILNWNWGRLTEECIEAVKTSDYRPLEITVVDNGSTDGSADSIAAHYPEVALIRNSANLGFAEGSNQAIRYAMERNAGYVLLLNNDAIVHRNTISRLVETATSHDNRVAVSPKIYNGFDPTRLWFVYGKANLWSGVFSNPAHNAPATTVFDPVLPMEYVVGCCLLIPRAVIRSVGEFDSRFFAYCEDVDWSLRTRQAGFGLLCDTRAELWHYVSSTGARNPAKTRYLMTRNHLWTLRKHATAYQFTIFALAFYPARCLLRIAKAIRHAQWGCIPAELHGALHGFLYPLETAVSRHVAPAPEEDGS